MMHVHANQMALPFLPPPAQPAPVMGQVVPFARTRLDWTADLVAILKTHFDNGLSHQLIAERMVVERGVVSAKLHRLGWTRPETRQARKPDRKPASVTKRLGNGLSLRLEALPAASCHWPTREDADGVQLFCGHPSSGTYCAGHDARAHRKAYAREEAATVAPAYAFEGDDDASS